MPQAENRDEREAELAELLWLAWLTWSDVPTFLSLSRSTLLQAISPARPILQDIWMGGYTTVLSQFGGARVARLEESYFDGFYKELTGSLASRWEERVKQYELDLESNNPYRPRWEHVRGAGQKVNVRVPGLKHESEPSLSEYGPTGVTEMLGDTEYFEYYDPETDEWFWVSEDAHPEDDRRVIGAKPLVYPSDADREGVNWVTGANTFGEFFAVRQVEKQGLGKIKGYWQTENDELVCEICGPLHGQPSRVWRPRFPNGPPAHGNCRCWVAWRRYFEPDPDF